METKIVALRPEQLAQVETEALAVIAAQLTDKAVEAVNAASGGLIAELFGSEEFSGKPLETATLTRPAGLKAKRLVVAGRSPELSGLELWRLTGAITRQLKGKSVHQLAVVLPDGVDPSFAVRAILTGVVAANFEPDTYKSDRKPERRIDALTLITRDAAAVPATVLALEAAAREAEIIAAGHQFARELANEPSNRLTPTIMGERAAAMARSAGLECELIDEAKARELKMGAFLGVAAGSAEPPVMIVLRYEGDPGNPRRLGIIGKGITFDTGGISIKPAANMDQMKFDMCGGAATLGAMQAIAALKPKLNVLAVVAAAENMPGGRAQKPGDVQIAMTGKSIEVLNTDAEGRMVLADALGYARQHGVTHLIDSATLTGACVVALGHVNSGVFANNEEYYQQFQRALGRSGEKMWRLPLDQEYADLIKGTVGDILNTGGRWGGAITAAQFLKEFVGDTPRIHLDIAGTAWLEENKAWMPKGPTGAPTYTLIELARELAGGV
jgi:leucyl aminopeptidase